MKKMEGKEKKGSYDAGEWSGTQRAMKKRDRQEKKEGTMRENAAKPKAKRAARAESETWTCKIAIRRKNRNQHSKYRKKTGRRKQPCASRSFATRNAENVRGGKTGVMV